MESIKDKYRINGCKISDYRLDKDGRLRFVHYKAFLCEFFILQMGGSTKFYYNGCFYPNLSFMAVEYAINYVRTSEDKFTKNLVKFFRKVYIKSWLYAIGAYI